MAAIAQLRQALTDSSEHIGLQGDYDLGILLVHGLGEQARGDTLTVQGDPLIAWLRGRVGATGRDGDPKVDVVDAASRQQSTDAIPSAHAVIRFTPPTDPSAPEAEPTPTFWVVAEAFWAENFRQATFNESIRWVFNIGPWVFATQVAAMYRRMEIGRHAPWWLRIGVIPITLVVGLAFVLLAAVAGFLITIAAAAVFILAMTNIPFLADVAKEIQRQLGNGLGDAQVLSRSPVRFSAMAAEVRTGLRILREKCSAVVVVSESQGTAVAWYGLKHEILGGLRRSAEDEGDTDSDADPEAKRKKDLAPISLFLTHGQAIRKLTFALHMARGKQTSTQTWAALLSAGFVAAGVAAFWVGAPWLTVPALILAIVAESRLIFLAKPVWDESGADIAKDWKELRAAVASQPAPGSGRLEWLDLWASADPAPVGPLGVGGYHIRSYKIRNLGSILTDHVNYWQNTTEFLPILASFFFRLGGPRRYVVPLHDVHNEVPAMRRHARVMLLLVMRVFVALGVVAGAIYATYEPPFGADLVAFIVSLDLPIITGFLENAGPWLPYVAGVVAVLVAGALVWLGVSGAWNGLMVVDQNTYFRGEPRPLWTWQWWLFGALAVPIAALVTWLLWTQKQETLAIGYLLAATAVTLVCLSVLSGGGRTYGSWEKQEETTTAILRISRWPWVSRAIVLSGFVLVMAIPIATAVLVVTASLPFEAFPLVLAVESIVLSAILAVEGIRAYRLFRKRFNRLNSRLPTQTKARSSPRAGQEAC